LAALLVAIVTLPQLPGGVRDWRERQRAQAALAEEQRDQLALERRARLYGWSGHGIDTFGVTLVTTPEELDRASIELGGYTDYVILRVSEHEHGANGNRAQSLRQIIENGATSRGHLRPASAKPSKPGSAPWVSRNAASRRAASVQRAARRAIIALNADAAVCRGCHRAPGLIR
jgi:hypothetical protein